MFALLRRSRQLDLPIDLQLELFDSLIMPMLLYGCENWGFENITMIEKIHLKYLKYILGLYTSPWLSEIKNILDNTGYSFIWLSQILQENFSIVHAVKKSLPDQYVQEWNTIINNSSNNSSVCYTELLKGILYLKTISLHCHHIIENHFVNLELLTINCHLRLDCIVAAQDLPEIVINVTWRNWAMNFIFFCNVQSYQISEERTYLYIAKIDLTFTNLKVLCPVMQFLLI